jgi:hypothetical protein
MGQKLPQSKIKIVKDESSSSVESSLTDFIEVIDSDDLSRAPRPPRNLGKDSALKESQTLISPTRIMPKFTKILDFNPNK